MTNRFGLAGAGLSNDHVPGQTIEVFSGRLEFFDPFGEVSPQIFQSAPGGRIGDSTVSARGSNVAPHFGCPSAAHPINQQKIKREDQDQRHYPDGYQERGLKSE